MTTEVKQLSMFSAPDKVMTAQHGGDRKSEDVIKSDNVTLDDRGNTNTYALRETEPEEPGLLYDCDRDHLEIGDHIIIYADGHRERVKVKKMAGEKAPQCEGWTHAVPVAYGSELAEMLYYLDGYAWGVDKNLNSVSVGRIQDVENYFSTGSTQGLTPEAVSILSEIKMEAKRNDGTIRTVKVDLRAPKFKQRGDKRIRPLRNSRNINRDIRPVPPRKRLTVHRH